MLYTEDQEIVKAFKSEFIEMLCLSGELTDDWIPNKYFKIDTENSLIKDWVIIEDYKNEGKIIPIKVESQKSGYGSFLIKILLDGLLFAADNYCLRCGRMGHNILKCYAKTHISGKRL